MKALTICNPYPVLILNGDKPLENRTWYTSFRGEFAIHAGKSRAWLDDGDEEKYPDMVFGAVVGVAVIDDCVPVDDLRPELAENEHANGPYCLVLTNVRRLPKPVPCSGAQGFWTLDPGVEAAVREQLKAVA